MTLARAVERPERPPRLRLLVAAPTIWAAHFLASYITAAVWCADAALGAFDERGKSLNVVAALIGAYSLAALAGIAVVVRVGLAKMRHGAPRWKDATPDEGSSVGELLGPAEPYDGDTDLDRTRFLGFATLLLCGVSVIGVVFAALVVVFLRDCR